MKTIVLSANPTPNMNLAKINIDHCNFDPHCGPSFWVTFYNPSGNIIDRITHSMTFDQWQDWTSESTEIADYKYIADSITEDLSITYISMDEPKPPAPPTITSQPASQSTTVGGAANFSVGYQGDNSFSFQWYKNDAAIQGQTASTFYINSVSESDAGSYKVSITNNGGSVTSAAAILTVTVPVAPTIKVQPENKTVETGGSTSLSVEVEGTAPLNYVWSKDGSSIPMGMGNVLPIMNAQSSNEGIYSVTVSNSVGSITSDTVTLTITPAPDPVVPATVTPSSTPDPVVPATVTPSSTPDPVVPATVTPSSTPDPVAPAT